MKNKIILIVTLTLSIFVLYLSVHYFSNKNTIPSENITSVLSILEDDTSAIAWLNQSTIDLNSLTASHSQGIMFNDSKIVITAGGNYIFSGTLENGSITVDTNEAVNLTFNNANITNLSGPALYIKDASQTYVTLISNTENFLVDGKDYSNTDATGTLYTQSPLTFQGGGSLDITSSSQNGISGHAPITINSGSIKVTAAKNGILTDNITQLLGGHLSIETPAIAINSKDLLKINDGVINIIAADVGLQSDKTLTINGGSINIYNVRNGIKSQTNLVINAGNINMSSTQNALLAATTLTINNGNIHLDSKGNALAASENITLNNGTVLAFSSGLYGSGSPFDTDTFTINGGILVATGNKMVLPNEHTSKQSSLILDAGLANSMVHIEQSGTDILTFMPDKGYDYLLFSSPTLTATSEYTLYSGGAAQDGTNFYGLYSDATYTGGEKLAHFTLNGLLTNLSLS